MSASRTCGRTLLIAFVVGLVPVAVVGHSLLAGRTTESMRRAATLVVDKQYANALQILEGMPRTDRDLATSQVLAARAIAGLGDNDEALKLYQQVRPSEPVIQLEAAFGIGSRLIALGQMQGAEPWLREVLRLNPGHEGALRILSRALQLQGRVWESQSLIWQLVVQDSFKGDDLHMLGTSQEFLADHSLVERSSRLAPNDPLPRLGRARQMLMRNQLEQSEELLREIIPTASAVSEASVALGRILLERGDDTSFLDWHEQLDEVHETHPDLWLLRGLWLRKHGHHEHAARCFWEAIDRMPNHVEASYQMSQVLSTLGYRDAARDVGLRSRKLAHLELSLAEFRGAPTVSAMRQIVFQLAELHRYWEAAAYCCLANRGMPQAAVWARADLGKYVSALRNDQSITISEHRPSIIVSMPRDTFPLPDRTHFKRSETIGSTDHDGVHTGQSSVRFTENARDVGFDFTFYNGSVTAKGLEHIFETTGGGIAVLDFDADLYPDIWAAQGSDIWTDNHDRTDFDQIFRNIDGELFVNRTQASTVREDLFSQGVAAGDINNDGFPDAFVANQGANRLYVNNGDGTFSEITAQSGLSGEVWSMSAAIADLNQDSIPDIYEVNYLQIESVLNRRCKSNGQPLTCAPTLFAAEQDRLWLGNGDGTFTDCSASSGIVQPEGKGLGLVAADFDGTGRISVFVGNDTTNNFFFRNVTSVPETNPLFEEQGLISGLAADGEGRAQATMGIAFGDADSDGLYDVFTTNFYADPNSLLLQQSEAYFVDCSRDSGIYDSGYNLLGFGSQFLDADLDGRPDLLVTNGHVDRTSATGEPDEMPPQFFWNIGRGKFVEPAPSDTGPFFVQKVLGRALSTLDWNCDGLPDAAISHLYAPAALLTNATRTVTGSLRISLADDLFERDANGATVTVSLGPDWPVQTKQLCAGNGYLSTNERVLVFALPADSESVTISVKWPDQRKQDYEYKVRNRTDRLQIIRGNTNELFSLPCPTIAMESAEFVGLER
jgi:tetratricopeptide (TPR) repeat protein